MKTKLSFLLLLFNIQYSIFNCFSQAGEWVWIHGDSLPYQPGNFGVQGVPDPTNNPPALYEPCEWADLNGNFWLFGGFSTNCQDNIWKYDPVTNEWTWMKGSGTMPQPAVYGTQGVPSPLNSPGNLHWCAASWVDLQGNFWMFGGSNGNGTCYNILWKYDPLTNEWTWMKGTTAPNDPGNYGLQGISDSINNPMARWETSATWVDSTGNLWLFGGMTHINIESSINDLWKYDPVTNEWTWMKGASLPAAPGIYGTIGIENSQNTPGAREVYSHWKGTNNTLWLFGGYSFGTGFGINDDLWRYNINTNNWAWMGGSNVGNTAGTYGTKCLTAPTNMPSCRFENRAAWTDPKGNFWFFGGVNFGGNKNDLWMYCLASNQWVWESGNIANNPNGHWGSIGVVSPANKPNGRFGSVGWTDNNGHFYLFGGGLSQRYNDLWKYTIDTTCGVCPINTSVQEQTDLSSTIEIFPNPADKSVVISSESGENNKAQLSVTNMLGDELYRCILQTPDFRLLTSSFPNGIYIVKASSQKGVFEKKLVVNH